MQIFKLIPTRIQSLQFPEPQLPHLMLGEYVLAPAAEWTVRLPGWCLIQVKAGHGYFMQPRANWELTPGATIVRADSAPGIIRASQLGALALNYFRVQPELLGGLASVGEQLLLNEMAAKQEFSFKVLPAESPIALRLQHLFSQHKGSTVLFRTQLLEVFLEASGHDWAASAAETGAPQDARQRLHELLKHTPDSELLGLSFSDLARTTNCTPRHLSRVFREIVGMSFREKQTRIRLDRAREILATTDRKIIDVALDSGYDSLSLFNLMFRRRFGTSPGKWRQNRLREGKKTVRPARKIGAPTRDQPVNA